MTNAIDGHRSLRHIGRHDDFAERIGLEGQVLFLRRQIAVERNRGETLLQTRGADGADGGLDFRHAGHEDQDVPRRLGLEDSLHGVGGLLRDGPFVPVVQVTDLDRKASTFGEQDRRRARPWLRHRFVFPAQDGGLACLVQILRHRLRLQGGGHHSQFQIGPLRLLELLHQRQGEVAEQVAFVKLVEQNDARVGKRPVILQPTQQNPLGHIADARAEGGSVVETNLVADFLAEFAPSFPGHSRGHGAGRDAPGL